jgi:hypothetical protein
VSEAELGGVLSAHKLLPQRINVGCEDGVWQKGGHTVALRQDDPHRLAEFAIHAPALYGVQRRPNPSTTSVGRPSTKKGFVQLRRVPCLWQRGQGGV